MKRILCLIAFGFAVLTSCDFPDPLFTELYSRGSDVETGPLVLDSITHARPNTNPWRTYFHYDQEGRVVLINRSDILNNWRREFEYEGDQLIQNTIFEENGSWYRDSLAYDDQGIATLVYRFQKEIDSVERLASTIERDYDSEGQLVETRTTSLRNINPGFINRKVYEWANGNVMVENFYNNDVLLFAYEFEYDDNPSPGAYTHFGLRFPDGIATRNNITVQNRVDYNAQPDGICTPCFQEHTFDEKGRIATTTHKEFSYEALYHY